MNTDGNCPAHMTGTDQYPATTAEERQVFFDSVKEVFQDLMFDASLGPLKDTSVATMRERVWRAVWYAADFVESTNSSKFALDAMKLDNIGPGDGASFGSLPFLRNGAAKLARDKAADRFFHHVPVTEWSVVPAGVCGTGDLSSREEEEDCGQVREVPRHSWHGVVPRHPPGCLLLERAKSTLSQRPCKANRADTHSFRTRHRFVTVSDMGVQ